MCSVVYNLVTCDFKILGRKEENALFNDTHIFYLMLYAVGNMVKDHSDSLAQYYIHMCV